MANSSRFRFPGKIVLAAALFLLLTAAALSAEINPVEYGYMQRAAQEQLIIEVLNVKSPWSLFKKSRSVLVTARVDHVYFSTQGLQTDDIITISYAHFKYEKNSGWVGPRSIPILKSGNFYPAFLYYSEESACYIPAAKGASFENYIPLE